MSGSSSSCRMILSVVLVGLGLVQIAAQSNTVGGKIVDSVTQQGLAGVQIVIHAVGSPSNVFDRVDSVASGRYQSDKINRQTKAFALQYTKTKYVEDARESVDNDVYSKELDSLALVSISAAFTSEPAMTAALEALRRFATVSGNSARAQSTMDALRRGDDGKMVTMVLSKNPQIAAALTRAGVR